MSNPLVFASSQRFLTLKLSFLSAVRLTATALSKYLILFRQVAENKAGEEAGLSGSLYAVFSWGPEQRLTFAEELDFYNKMWTKERHCRHLTTRFKSAAMSCAPRAPFRKFERILHEKLFIPHKVVSVLFWQPTKAWKQQVEDAVEALQEVSGLDCAFIHYRAEMEFGSLTLEREGYLGYVLGGFAYYP